MTPQWMTAERLAKLGELCERDDHLCLKGHRNCPDKTHYQWARPHKEWAGVPGGGAMQLTVWEWESAYLHEATIEEAIASWKADDREQRALDWKREQQAIIDGTYGKYGSRFDPVSRDQFMAQRPEYYLTATGMDGMHFTPVVVVRVPSTSIYLFVNVSAAFVKTTKSQRRHAHRHGKPVQEVMVTVEDLCKEAVRLWWNKRS